MCLLIVASRVDADAPLLAGANRDERFDRPAIPLTVLRAAQPRILGGRDMIDDRVAGSGGIRAAIRSVLKDHSIPPGAEQEMAKVRVDGKPLPIEVAAACVHTESYGTRSAALVEVSADRAAIPSFAVA